MNDLNINYEETINLGREIMNKGDELGEIIFKIQSILASLQMSWQGTAGMWAVALPATAVPLATAYLR